MYVYIGACIYVRMFVHIGARMYVYTYVCLYKAVYKESGNGSDRKCRLLYFQKITKTFFLLFMNSFLSVFFAYVVDCKEFFCDQCYKTALGPYGYVVGSSIFY